MLHHEKAALRQEIRLSLNETAETLRTKSRLIQDRLATIDAFQHARQSERLMEFVSTPSEVDTAPLFTAHSMIVPYCEADNIVPIRILSWNELAESGSLNILEPVPSVRQDISRRISPEQIDVVLVPGLSFDLFGNRLGRGRGYYDRFLRQLPEGVLTIGLAFDAMIRSRIPYGENDQPVKMVVTESRMLGKPGS